jgi:putative acetyltransferase
LSRESERRSLAPAIRPERPDDRARVHAVQSAAFGRRDEADLVDRLRADAAPTLSLVAESDARVVGHVFFSPVSIEGHPGLAVSGLAPLAVDPAAQGRGVGTALVRAGLRACARHHWRAGFVLGDPGYYARFGFGPAAPRGFHYQPGHDAAFQLIELAAEALAGCSGRVHYHEAFGGL